MTHALVTGATGYVGARLVAALARAGVTVTAAGRNLGKLDGFDFPPQVGRVELDVSDPQACRRAFAAAEQDGRGPATVAYFLVHSIGEGDWARHDLDSARVFAAQAKAAGVARLVYLAGFVPQDEHLSEHLASRAQVGHALHDAGPELVWLRAAVILGAGSTSYELIRHIAQRLPVIPIPAWMNHAVAPIAVSDVVHYLVTAADRDRIPAGSYEISNSEEPTYAGLIELFARVHGLRRVWIPFPPVAPRLVARVAAWLTPLPHALTADLILSLPNTMATHDERIRALVPDPPGGLVTTVEALRRSIVPDPTRGVFATADPLQLTDTDASWAR